MHHLSEKKSLVTDQGFLMKTTPAHRYIW